MGARTTGGACETHTPIPANWARVTRPIYGDDHDLIEIQAFWGPVLERHGREVVIDVYDEPFHAHPATWQIEIGDET